MTNSIDATGIHTDDLPTIIARRTAEKQAIYGNDINVASNTPDGQQININAQAERDLLDLAVDVYNAKDPDKAVGADLDVCCALNGVIRNGGTYSVTPINITVDRALTLAGLDANYLDPNGVGYTVSDNLGNTWILVSTYSFVAAGTQSLNFRAGKIGSVTTTPNTIVNQTTITVGVTAVNNPSAQSSTGTDTELDAELRIRRLQSISLPALGTLDSIQAKLLNLPAVTAAKVYENNTGGVVNTMVAHSIWAIVAGGADADIANIIYKGKDPGCAMNGAVSVAVLRLQGDTFTVLFDRPVAKDLYIKFSLQDKGVGGTYDASYVKTTLAAALVYNMGDQADTASIIDILSPIVPGFVPYAVSISINNTNWFQLLSPTLLKNYFSVSATNITIV